MHLVLVNRLGSLPRNSIVRLTDGSPYAGYLKNISSSREKEVAPADAELVFSNG